MCETFYQNCTPAAKPQICTSGFGYQPSEQDDGYLTPISLRDITASQRKERSTAAALNERNSSHQHGGTAIDDIALTKSLKILTATTVVNGILVLLCTAVSLWCAVTISKAGFASNKEDIIASIVQSQVKQNGATRELLLIVKEIKDIVNQRQFNENSTIIEYGQLDTPQMSNPTITNALVTTTTPVFIVSASSSTVERCAGFTDGGKCFTVVIKTRSTINYYEARRLCTEEGAARLGNIYTLSQFNKLRDHVFERKDESGTTATVAWTDMRREIPSGRILLENGSSPSYDGTGNLRRNGEWRTDDNRRTNIYVFFWTDGVARPIDPNGYGNAWPSFGWYGGAALCEKDIK